jgi:hypothetical protein
VVNLPTRLIAEQVRGPHRGRQSLPFFSKENSETSVAALGRRLPYPGPDRQIWRAAARISAATVTPPGWTRKPTACPRKWCSGAAIGEATMESSWAADHATGSVHFVGISPKP